MGASYTNITLRGPIQSQVGDFLDRENIVAYVTPAFGDITVVYDQASADMDEAALAILAQKLSQSLGCVAFAASVYDSDIFQYDLYVSGVLTDEYNSCPNYWDDEAEGAAPPAGGDAEKICTTFGVTDKIANVSKMLRRYDADPFAEDTASDENDSDAYVFEEHRHADLADALSLPDYVVCASFRSCGGGLAPEGLSASSMRRTGPTD